MLRKTHPPTGSPWRAAATAGLLILLAWGPTARGRPQVRAQLGPAYEFTNLIYQATDRTYLGTVCDSLSGAAVDSCNGNAVFSDTSIVASTPQSSGGGMARFTLTDTLSADRYYWVEPELKLQTGLVTGHLYGTWRWAAPGGLVTGLTQRFDHTLDQRFGYTRRIDTESLTGVLGLRTSDLAWSVEFRPALQVDRTNHSPELYIQDANGGRFALDASHLAPSGQLLDLEAHWGLRSYPDSALLDYRETFAQFSVSQPLPAGLHSLLTGSYERRSGPSELLRNDLYTRTEGEADVGWQGLDWGLRGHALGEDLSYLRPNSVFFDSRLLRFEMAGSRTASNAWDLELRPRVELLDSPDLPGESYQQASFILDVTRMRGGLLDLSLEAGRRHYTGLDEDDRSVDTTGLIVAHSDYHYYGISMLINQPILPTVSLRGTFDLTTEIHDVAEDNNHILFLSSELSYSFWMFGR